jgi:alkylation response protein AidB-like acyl-CoA dehydrogenase
MMYRLTQSDGLTDVQQDILGTVRAFVDAEIIPVAGELNRSDTYPERIVAGLAELGVFGLTIGQEYGGLNESLLTYALVAEEIARGWMSVSGIINTHFIVAYMIGRYGTAEQKESLLPRMATGEMRAAFSMSEPDLGSDVAAIRTAARPDGDDYVISGQKMWLTNGASARLVALLARTPEGATPASQPDRLPDREGKRVRADATRAHCYRENPQDGYKGVDTTGLVLEECWVPAARVLGELPGRGFYQMMDAVELGRVNVAARACGVAHRAFELAITYAQHRETFGKPIAQHQAIEFKLCRASRPRRLTR